VGTATAPGARLDGWWGESPVRLASNHSIKKGSFRRAPAFPFQECSARSAALIPAQLMDCVVELPVAAVVPFNHSQLTKPKLRRCSSICCALPAWESRSARAGFGKRIRSRPTPVPFWSPHECFSFYRSLDDELGVRRRRVLHKRLLHLLANQLR
jgi:hypothetical protein